MTVSKSLKIIYVAICMSLAPLLFANSYWVETMDPYYQSIPESERVTWDAEFVSYINTFKNPVNVTINELHGKEGDFYLYFYVVNSENVSDFSIDVNCPNTKNKSVLVFDITSDPILKNQQGIVNSNNEIIWMLNPRTVGAQGMWFYSSNPPVKRAYTLSIEDASKSRINLEGDIGAESLTGMSVGISAGMGVEGQIEGPGCPKKSAG